MSAAPAQSLHVKVDAAMDAARIGPAAPAADDAEFLRRAWLVLTGTPPTGEEARAFLADTSPHKRALLITGLAGSREFMRHLAVQLDVMLMERRAETHTKSAEWRRWLEDSLAAGKSWDLLVRDLLAHDGSDEKTRPVARWLLERQAEPNLLTRDAGRLFLGRDMACAQCHDHPRVDDYAQRDYHGLFAFFGRTSRFQPDPKVPALVAESAIGEAAWSSVFTKISGASGPRLPDGKVIAEPVIADAEQWTVAPNEKDKNVRAIPKYSRRAQLADALVADAGFRRNIANRVWGLVMGRCLVEPPDLLHSGNPPAHPVVLDLLADEIATMKFDLRSFIQEIALTKAFAQAFDPAPAAPEVRASLTAKLPALEAEAAKLKAESERCGVAFTESGEALEKAHHDGRPALEEWKKLTAAHAAAAAAAGAATAELKKSEDKKRALADAAAKLKAAAEAGAAAVTTAPEDKDLAAATKTFQDKLAKVSADEAAADKDMAAKKSAADAKAAETDKARQAADAKKPAADEAEKRIAAITQQRETTDAARRTARVASQLATQRLNEANALLDYAVAAAAETPAGEEAAMNIAPVSVSLEDARAALAKVGGHAFDVTSLAPLPPEQLCWSILKVTGALEQIRESAVKEWDDKHKADATKQAARSAEIEELTRTKTKPHEDQFVRLFANSAGQPQNDFFATADQVLYFENAGSVRSWTQPSGNNLAARLAKLTDPAALTRELYLAVLTRVPSDDEAKDIASLLGSRPPEQRNTALSDAIWALLTSTEFRFRH